MSQSRAPTGVYEFHHLCASAAFTDTANAFEHHQHVPVPTNASIVCNIGIRKARSPECKSAIARKLHLSLGTTLIDFKSMNNASNLTIEVDDKVGFKVK